MDENQVFGIVTLIVCAVGYFFSWKYFFRSDFPKALLLLIICGLILRVYFSTDFFLHFWDERYHALVAKNMMHHFFVPTLYDTTFMPQTEYSWTNSHIWLHKPPLPLWAMAISMKLFGVNEIAVRLPSILLSTGAIVITYFLGKYFWNQKAGFIAALLFSINGLLLDLSSGRAATDHFDTFYLVFIELSIYLVTVYAGNRKTIYNVLAGICLGAATLTKWLPALIVLPLWLLILSDSKKLNSKQLVIQFMIFSIVTVAVFLPWQIYIYNMFPIEAGIEARFNLRHITELLDDHGGPFYYYLDKIRINYGDLIYLPLIWFFWGTFKKTRQLKNLALTVWVVIPILFFSFAQTKMQGYIVFVSPALFIITAMFFLKIREDVKLPKWMRYTILVLLLSLPIRYCIERMKLFNKIERSLQWTNELKSLGKQDYANGILFNYKAPIEAMFYTNLTVYPFLPDSNTIKSLIKKGHTVLINDDGTIPESISSINSVVKRKFLPVGGEPD